VAERLRALVVSYAFPPVGGAGVQRSVKLVKYLPEHGVDAEVLTVDNPSVPVTDSTFGRDLEGVVVHRAPTLEPGYGVKRAGWKSETTAAEAPSLRQRALRAGVALGRQVLVPDPQVLWVPGASRKLHELAADYDVVAITAPPFSQFLLGPVARRKGPALVLDYRDEWSTLRASYENLQGGLGRWVGDPLERRLLRQADAVVAATPAFVEHMLTRFEFLDPERIHAISNGFDSDDYPSDPPAPPRDHLQLTYAGTVFHLTSPRGLLDAVRRLHEREPELASHLRLRFIGRVVPSEEDAFEGTEALGVERLGYIPHGDLMGYLSSSHVVLCIQDDVPGTERIYPGKIFELMNLGRPIWTLSRRGALTELVDRLGLGAVMQPRDSAEICTQLEALVRTWKANDGVIPAAPVDQAAIGGFHRRALAGRWAEALRRAVAHRRRA
jgi:glycosyltransferase involved in cell wall biosynthesis